MLNTKWNNVYNQNVEQMFNKMTINSKIIGIRVSPELEEVLDNLAKATHKSKSFHVKEALKRYLEDALDYIEGINVLNSNPKTYSLKETKKILGIHDKK